MRIIVFSDVHGNQFALRVALPMMEKEQASRLFFLGDVFGYYYGQVECLNYLRQMRNLTCLLGNHEELYFHLLNGQEDAIQLAKCYGSSYLNIDNIGSKNEDFLRHWDFAYKEIVDGCRIGFFHGTPDCPLHGRLYPDTEIEDEAVYTQYDVVFLGHTHHKMRRKCGMTWIYNPGSLGQQRDGQGCSYIVFDTVSREAKWQIVPYDKQLLLKEIELRDPDMQKLRDPLLRDRGRWNPGAL